jgi:hypothetical protein
MHTCFPIWVEEYREKRIKDYENIPDFGIPIYYFVYPPAGHLYLVLSPVDRQSDGDGRGYGPIEYLFK